MRPALSPAPEREFNGNGNENGIFAYRARHFTRKQAKRKAALITKRDVGEGESGHHACPRLNPLTALWLYDRVRVGVGLRVLALIKPLCPRTAVVPPTAAAAATAVISAG